MAIFILVHGAWHGAWCWQRVRARLGEHEVVTPVLAGMGERVGEPASLERHIREVAEVVSPEAVLVGHSYAGMIVRAISARMRIYVDAYVPEPGEAMLDLRPPGTNALLRVVDGLMLPPPAEAFGVRLPEDRAWVDSRLTPMPFRCYQDAFPGPVAPGPSVYVRAGGYPQPSFDGFERGFQRRYRVESGHDVMVDAPDALVEILLNEAG